MVVGEAPGGAQRGLREGRVLRGSRRRARPEPRRGQPRPSREGATQAPPRIPGGERDAATACGEYGHPRWQRRALRHGRRRGRQAQLHENRRRLRPGHAHGPSAGGEAELGRALSGRRPGGAEGGAAEERREARDE
eukprot:9079189-Alexandrium_andersonii.AAC.1